MAASIRGGDRLEGAINFIPWKARIILLFKENDLWDVVESTVAKPVVVPTVAADLTAFNKKDVKAMRIILDAIKDHVVPHVSNLDHAFRMWNALTDMY